MKVTEKQKQNPKGTEPVPNSDFSIDISKPDYETEESDEIKTKKTRKSRKTKVVKKEFPIPLSGLAQILATLPFTLIQKWITSFPKLSAEEETALKKAWCDYLEYALEPDVITPAYSLLACYGLLLSSRAMTIAPEVADKIRKAKKAHNVKKTDYPSKEK